MPGRTCFVKFQKLFLCGETDLIRSVSSMRVWAVNLDEFTHIPGDINPGSQKDASVLCVQQGFS